MYTFALYIQNEFFSVLWYFTQEYFFSYGLFLPSNGLLLTFQEDFQKTKQLVKRSWLQKKKKIVASSKWDVIYSSLEWPSLMGSHVWQTL